YEIRIEEHLRPGSRQLGARYGVVSRHAERRIRGVDEGRLIVALEPLEQAVERYRRFAVEYGYAERQAAAELIIFGLQTRGELRAEDISRQRVGANFAQRLAADVQLRVEVADRQREVQLHRSTARVRRK